MPVPLPPGAGDLPQRLSATAQDLRPSDDALARLRADNAQLAAQCEQLTGAVARLEDALAGAAGWTGARGGEGQPRTQGSP